MKPEGKRGQFGVFSRAVKIYAVVVLVIGLAVISWLEPYPTEGRLVGNLKWSPEADRIPLRAIERIANRRFVAWAAEPIVLEAVKQANAKGPKSLDEIISLDKKWRQGGEAESWVRNFLNNPCGQYLRRLKNEHGGERYLYAEIFVTDRQGCIVATAEKTSDYWQGDEDKFVKTFAGGRGNIFVDEAAYDLSTETPLIQVSVPVVDPDTGQAIGVMTVGLYIKVLAEQI